MKEKKAHFGECKLCGKNDNLTYEHIPPQHAFNSFPVKTYKFEEAIKIITGADGRKPWEFGGLYGKINQRGGGGYFLCSQCNSNTGTWYVSEYVKMTQILHTMIVADKLQPNNSYGFELLSLYPLRIFKAIMTMFCDINNKCFGDQQLKEFLLDKESKDIDLNKYKVYLTLVTPQMRRIQSLSAIGNIFQNEPVLISEVSSYPVGCMLCIDKPEWYQPNGILINDFAKHNYNDKCNIEFIGIPYYDINSHMPGDFRTRKQIEDTIKSEDEETN